MRREIHSFCSSLYSNIVFTIETDVGLKTNQSFLVSYQDKSSIELYNFGNFEITKVAQFEFFHEKSMFLIITDLGFIELKLTENKISYMHMVGIEETMFKYNKNTNLLLAITK